MTPAEKLLPTLCPRSQRVLRAVLASMEHAEGMNGPEPMEYVKLMEALAAEVAFRKQAAEAIVREDAERAKRS